MPIEDTLFSLAQNQQQVISAWSGFNVLLRKNSIPRESSIGYCQVIEASPTELPTVYTVLQRSLQMAQQLRQHDVIVVFDQAIYSYLDMLEVLMNFVRATREGNWNLHLECIKEMLPWLFGYDHTNYACYLPVYLAQIMLLPEIHPEAHARLLNGDFGVQQETSHGFSQMPVDQTIEQTLNRST